MTSRFGPEAEQEPYVRGLKQLTTKPVVGVGRFTSPDTMVHQIKSGVLDFIGAARPSIADPFLPKKIETGHLEDIRECIGCNICVSGDFTMSPIRCTQNPTMGEEFRRGWHPEAHPGPQEVRLARPRRRRRPRRPRGGPRRWATAATPSASPRPAGVSAAASTREAKLPGLSAWIRVVDYRRAAARQARQRRRLHAERDDGRRHHRQRLRPRARSPPDRTGAATASAGGTPTPSRSPSDARRPQPRRRHGGPPAATGKRVVLFDDDHYYLGGVLAELLAAEGFDVTLITPAAHVSQWTVQHPRGGSHPQARDPRRRSGADEHGRDRHRTRPGRRTACVFTGDRASRRRMRSSSSPPDCPRIDFSTHCRPANRNGPRRPQSVRAASATPGRLPPSPPRCGPDTVTPRSSTNRPTDVRCRSDAKSPS